MKSETIRDIIWGVIFVIIQVVLVRHLRIFNTYPDIIWVFVLWLATSRERMYTVLMTAGLAFMQDALLDLWGLHMFSKVFVVFILYNFLPRTSENRLITLQVFVLILVSSLLLNLILVGVATFFDLYNTNIFVLNTIIGNSFYTAIAGSFIYLFSSNADTGP